VLAILVRLEELSAAEPLLLDWIRQKPDFLGLEPWVLLALLRLKQLDLANAELLVRYLYDNHPTSVHTRWILVQYLLQRGDLCAIDSLGDDLWLDKDKSLLLQLAYIALLLKRLRLAEAQELLDHRHGPECLEVLRLKARCLALQGDPRSALALLQPALHRAPKNRSLMVQLLELVIEAHDAPQVLPTIRHAIGMYGEHPDLLCHVTTVKLFQRQPGLARRSALLQQAWASVRPTPINLANQISSYEQTGHADWLPHLLPQFSLNPLADLQMHSNLAMHLASIESSSYSRHVNGILEAVKPTKGYADYLHAGSGVPKPVDTGQPLRIAWVTADLTPHPVSRFLIGFFEASRAQRIHSHTLVSLRDHASESCAHWFEGLEDVDLLDVSATRDQYRVAAIRELRADLAIDLSGWTGGHFMAGFIARLAAVQVNYLGYFASAGIPQMDYWLGDEQLFPCHGKEWHTERLWRLRRPFLAWQPAGVLPEASVEVMDAHSGPVHFGSFNHNRKLSDRTLRLWGAVLSATPGSRLVLKANAKDDLSTQELLRRRMVRAGLDPERVIWLPLVPTPTEHLHQYRLIDIALDPLPNGGCTTTCEALWMGVPVITLEGATYVSRMSTAVLRGAGLDSWVCTSEEAYVELARQKAAQLAHLRSSRHQWRLQVAASPLGNAADLMAHLEQAFSAMHAAALKSQ